MEIVKTFHRKSAKQRDRQVDNGGSDGRPEKFLHEQIQLSYWKLGDIIGATRQFYGEHNGDPKGHDGEGDKGIGRIMIE